MTVYEKRIKSLLLSLGIHSTYKGYFYMQRAIDMAYEDPTCLLYVSKYMYPHIAREFHTSTGCVERNMRTVVVACWNSPYRERLLEISPQRLVERPTVGEFIDLLYHYLRFTEDGENGNTPLYSA